MHKTGVISLGLYWCQGKLHEAIQTLFDVVTLRSPSPSKERISMENDELRTIICCMMLFAIDDCTYSPEQQ